MLTVNIDKKKKKDAYWTEYLKSTSGPYESNNLGQHAACYYKFILNYALPVMYISKLSCSNNLIMVTLAQRCKHLVVYKILWSQKYLIHFSYTW